MSDPDLMLTAWLRPGARRHGLLWAEYIAHHGCSEGKAAHDLGVLADLRLVDRYTPKPGEGRYPPGGPRRGRPPRVYRLTSLGEAVLNGLEARDSAGDG